jgi:hypothetical protein
MNKVSRFEFVLSQINTLTMGTRSSLKYYTHYDKVHIDEKWFYVTQDGEAYILLEDEDDPYRHTKHKSFIEKVMFLCAQAHPRWDHTANKMWDGKLGIWPIGRYTQAQRSSVNRPAGTREWTNENIDHESYRDLLVNEVLTAIMLKWPAGEFNDPSFVIKVQQDGAGGHCSHDDEYLADSIEELGLTGKIQFHTQPANSPDLNILDLGLFNALHASYYDYAPKNSVECIECVQKTYDQYPHGMTSRIFITQ